MYFINFGNTSQKLVSISFFLISIATKAFSPRLQKLLLSSRRIELNGLLSTNTAAIQTKEIDLRSKRFQDDAYAFYLKLRSYNDTYLAPVIQSSLDVLADALRLYGPGKLISSFNGGKDAVVVMHLLRAAVAKYSHDHNITNGTSNIIQPQFMYFAIKEEFPEVLEFINQTEQSYGLNLIRYDCGIMQGLERHIRSLNSTDTVAFVLGTRVGDTNAHGQETFTPSSSWIPVPFMRVNPILKWEYGQVWKFLRDFQLPYCSLYDQGYTSLGKTSDTLPNPYLRKKGFIDELESLSNDSTSMNTIEEYWPAYMLADWTQERAGRISSQKNEAFNSTPAVSVKVQSQPLSLSLSNDIYSTRQGVLNVETAGFIVIGDEILDGSIAETNMQVAAKLLGSSGIAIKKVSIISDDVDEIAHEIRLFSQKYDVVITSGGVGPTHDDVTIKGVATAFGKSLIVNQEMLSNLKEIESMKSNPSILEANESSYQDDEHLRRLATLPENALLRYPPNILNDDSENSKSISPKKRNVWPILQCENVFVLPGVPKYFATKIPIIVKHFIHPTSPKKYQRKIALNIAEQNLLNILNEVVHTYPSVKFGSYPYVDNPSYQTIITMSCSHNDVLTKAWNTFLQYIPKEFIVNVHEE